MYIDGNTVDIPAISCNLGEQSFAQEFLVNWALDSTNGGGYYLNMFTTRVTACGLWPFIALLPGTACCKPSWSSLNCTTRSAAWDGHLCMLCPAPHPCRYVPASWSGLEQFWWCDGPHKIRMKISTKRSIFRPVPSRYVHRWLYHLQRCDIYWFEWAIACTKFDAGGMGGIKVPPTKVKTAIGVVLSTWMSRQHNTVYETIW